MNYPNIGKCVTSYRFHIHPLLLPKDHNFTQDLYRNKELCNWTKFRLAVFLYVFDFWSSGKKKPWSPYKVVHFSKQKSWLIKYILRRVFALGCTQLRTFLSWRSALMVTKKWLWAIIIIFNLITRFSCKALNKRKQVLAWKDLFKWNITSLMSN